MSLCNKVTSTVNDFTQKFFRWPSVVSLTSDPLQSDVWPDLTYQATDQIKMRYLIFLKLFLISFFFFFGQKTVELNQRHESSLERGTRCRLTRLQQLRPLEVAEPTIKVFQSCKTREGTVRLN